MLTKAHFYDATKKQEPYEENQYNQTHKSIKGYVHLLEVKEIVWNSLKYCVCHLENACTTSVMQHIHSHSKTQPNKRYKKGYLNVF